MSMIARDAALLMHEHHHGGSAIPASQMDGKISTAGSYRAIYRQYGLIPRQFFSRLPHLGRLQTMQTR